MKAAIQSAAVDFVEYAKTQKNLRHTPSDFIKWFAYISNWVYETKRILTEGYLYKGEEYSFLSALHALCCDIPPRYVSADLLAAWRHTKIPILTWNRPEVLPGYVLFMPLPHAITEWKECAHVGNTNYIAAMILNEPEGLRVFYHLAVFDRYDQPHVMLSSILIEPDEDYNHKAWDSEFRFIASLAINSWLIHAHEPQLITQEPIKSTPGAGFSRKSASRSPIAPTWIGRHFKVRRERHAEQPGETGVKVRPHWRSGHWHTVRHGKGKEATRLQWYRPVYVNAGPAA